MRKTVLFSTLVLSFILSTLILTGTSKAEDKEYNNITSAKGEFFNCLIDCCKVSGGEWISADEFRQAFREALLQAFPLHPFS